MRNRLLVLCKFDFLKLNMAAKGTLLTNTNFKSKVYLFLIFLFSSISAFLYPLLHFPTKCIARDWGLFNSFSLFSNSCWNYYGKLPVHNPYILGGIDNLANPQTKVFSPLAIFDIFFTAPIANLLSLLTLAIIGSYGFYHLLKYLKVSKTVSIIVSILFIHASWFHLHYAEGHIIFGSFLLFGFAILFILRLNESRFKLFYALLCAFFLLDGAMYAFIYCQLLLVFMYVFRVNDIRFKVLFKSVLDNKLFSILSFFVFVGIASVKLIPLLLLHGNRTPILENITLDAKSVFHAFFDADAQISLNVPGANYLEFVHFHEIGAYIGFLAFGIILYFLIKTRFRNALGFSLITLFFFWIGSGWLDPFNPWRIFQQIPVINNAHIQSRAFIVVYCFLIILLAFGLDYIKTRKKNAFMILSILLLVEGFWISNYPYYKVYSYEGSTMNTAEFPKGISNTKIDATYPNPDSYGWGFDFEHYNRHNAATKTFMDPSSKQTNVKSIDEADYKGEIYIIEGSGSVSTNKYVPGELEIVYDLDKYSKIQVNTNYLLGWKSQNDKVDVLEENGLLTLNIPKGSGKVIVLYSPNYLVICLALFVMGILTSIYLMFKVKTSIIDQSE